MSKSVWMNELTWEEVAEYLEKDDIVLVPVGSTEQHGPAGPLGLDTYAAIALAEDVAQKAGVLSTPPLWFGDSAHHLGFAGTISLSTETLAAVVKDICRSLARHGFRRILIINGHKSSNLPALLSATRYLHEHELPHVLFAVVDPMYLARGIAARVKETFEHHAGELEISHVWYRFPHLIHPERIPAASVPLEQVLSGFCTRDLLGPNGDTIEVVWNSGEQKAFAPTGAFSDASKASPEKGKAYHDYMVDRLVEFISWIRTYGGPVGSAGKRTEV
ncbi:MAG: creatininase family protein [Bacillota bacterium]|nr:creatininase family protein [Bacillota bacterium]